MVVDDSTHGLERLLVEVSPLIRLFEIVKEPTVSATIITSQHPADARSEFALAGKHPNQAVLSKIVDIADVLILHGIGNG